MPSDDRKILKRFRNLDIDGVDRPARPEPRPAEPSPARQRGDTERRSAPPVRRSEPAPDRGRQATTQPQETTTPSIPMRPAAMQRETLTVRNGGMTVERLRMDISGRGEPIELPPGTRPGVITVEFTPTPRAQEPPRTRAEAPRRAAPPQPAQPPPPRTYTMPPAPATLPGGAPIELTEMAARQLRIMAYQHGMSGAGLRILTSGPGGPSNCDFAFEHAPDEGDVVFLSHGVRVIVDRASLRTLRGMRITYDDIAGASGFRVG